LKTHTWKICLLIVGLAVLPLVGCSPAEKPAAEEPMAAEPAAEPMAAPATAMAELMDAAGNVVGDVKFSAESDGVHVEANVEGATPGMHGIHIHEFGECVAPDFKSAGGHFNPAGVDHACPPTSPRHAGDLGNIEVAEDGTGSLSLVVSNISLEGGDTMIVGHAMILHAGTDDCVTQPTGDAGGRFACGVITGTEMMDDHMDEGAMDDHMDEGAMDDHMDEGGSGN